MNRNQLPYVVAVGYSLAVALFGSFVLTDPPPRFADFYLIGMMFVTLRWSWRPALVVYVFSMIDIVWLLPLRPTFDDTARDGLRIALYVATAAAAIFTIESAKRA